MQSQTEGFPYSTCSQWQVYDTTSTDYGNSGGQTHLSPIRDHLLAQVSSAVRRRRYFLHTFDWHLLTDPTVICTEITLREVTIPWDPPVNLRHIKGPDIHLGLWARQIAILRGRRRPRFNEDWKTPGILWLIPPKRDIRAIYPPWDSYIDVTPKSPLNDHT